jgi:hypothetical protein
MCRDWATDPEVVVECGRTRIAGELAHRAQPLREQARTTVACSGSLGTRTLVGPGGVAEPAVMRVQSTEKQFVAPGA